MRIDVNGTRLWFDVDGPALVPDGHRMRERPTVVLIHGGPGGYDHSYFKPDFGRLTEVAQVVYLDMRDHGRSASHGAEGWSFETCADDVAAFCDALGIERPIVAGHSMGGMVAATYAIRHADQPRGVMLLSTWVRFDLHRLTEGFRRAAGDDVADLARRAWADEPVTEDEWATVFAAYGPNVPSPAALARRRPNTDLDSLDVLETIDLVADLPRIVAPTLVLVGELDSVSPVEASEEIAAGLPPGVGRLEVIPDAGHFAWLDEPEAFWEVVIGFTRDLRPSPSGGP